MFPMVLFFSDKIKINPVFNVLTLLIIASLCLPYSQLLKFTFFSSLAGLFIVLRLC